MKVCFGTVIYRQAKPFFKDLVGALSGQSYKDFDVLIANDNYDLNELADMGVIDEVGKPRNLVDGLQGSVYFLNLQPLHLSIAQTRLHLIKEAKRLGYELLVIGDADDTFVPTRIENHWMGYKLDKRATFFYNELVTDKGETVLYDLPDMVEDVRPVSQSNFLGMSTTSINLTLVDEEWLDSLAEGDTAVFDWYFYSRILMDIGYGRLVHDAATIYRIHEGNEVGVTHDPEQERSVKLIHYRNLAKRYPYFQHLYDDLSELDLAGLDISHDHHGYWWSNIIMEDSYEI